jgi:uncharacterized protein with von Willebrand factor type A (vWA) domain
VLTIRYTEWDGSQRIRLSADRVFEKFAEYLSYTDDVQQALDWLMRHGLDLDSVPIMGVDDFLEQLREEMRARYNKFNLEHALDEMRERLEEILDLERDTLDEKGEDAAAREKRARLDQLPPRLSTAIEQLRDYHFCDDQAGAEFERLLDEIDNISGLEQFRQRYRDMFQGPEAAGYEQALELMREMERFKQLEDLLASGDLDQIDLDQLRELLGEQAADDLRNLRQVLLLLKNAGYMRTRAGRSELSPKGVRKIGQIALREIFQGCCAIERAVIRAITAE